MKKSTKYSVVVHEEALEFLLTARLSERRQIMAECSALARDPFVVADYERTDADGRPIYHLLKGRFAIAYWIDHAERLVMISRIDPADA